MFRCALFFVIICIHTYAFTTYGIRGSILHLMLSGPLVYVANVSKVVLIDFFVGKILFFILCQKVLFRWLCREFAILLFLSFSKIKRRHVDKSRDNFHNVLLQCLVKGDSPSNDDTWYFQFTSLVLYVIFEEPVAFYTLMPGTIGPIRVGCA